MDLFITSSPTDLAKTNPVLETFAETQNETAIAGTSSSIIPTEVVLMDEDEELDYFTKPIYQNLNTFFKFHPHQPKSVNLNFQPEKVYLRKDGSHRKWLSFSQRHSKFFCSVCLAFGKVKDEKSSFVVGFGDIKHLHQNLDRHEKSSAHGECVNNYLREKSEKTIVDFIDINSRRLRNEQVERKWVILKRVIDVTRTLGKCGLAFRGKRNEAAYTLKDEGLYHGNFLEIILLVAKYDPVLQTHIDEVSAKSQGIHDKGSKQGGGLITFLSKTTINYVIDAIKDEMMKKISAEIKEAGMYSVQIDTTMDVSIKDQCSVIADM